MNDFMLSSKKILTYRLAHNDKCISFDKAIHFHWYSMPFSLTSFTTRALVISNNKQSSNAVAIGMVNDSSSKDVLKQRSKNSMSLLRQLFNNIYYKLIK